MNSQKPNNLCTFKFLPHKEELVSAIEEYIKYYNTGRYRITLSCMTPMEYHEAYAS